MMEKLRKIAMRISCNGLDLIIGAKTTQVVQLSPFALEAAN